MYEKRMVKNKTDWKLPRKKARTKAWKTWMDDLLDDLELIRITIVKTDVWLKLVKKSKATKKNKKNVESLEDIG